MSPFRNHAVRLLGVVAAVGILGCGGGGSVANAPAQPFRGERVVVGAVGDPAVLSAVAAQQGEWKATRGAELTVRESPVDPKETQGVDVLIFPGDRLGDLVDVGALAVLPESVVRPPPPPVVTEEPGEERPRAKPADPLQFADVVPALGDQVSRYGKDRVGLPYGASALVLIYRRDAFEREENRSAAGKENVTLEPPRTWSDFDALARFFHGRDWDGDGSADSGVALALGADAEGVGTTTFLARAAALGQHRDQYSFLFEADSMEPRIDSPPFVEALRATAALKAYGPPGSSEFDAEAAREAFRNGKVALLIDRAELAARWGGGGQPIGVAPLPGSGRVYDPGRKLWENASPPNRPTYLPRGGGWLVGVAASASGRRREAAVDFAAYLIGPEASAHVRADRAFPLLAVRASQLGQGLPDPRSAPGVESRQWSDAVSRALNAARVVPGLRIPQAEAYLADLDKARAAAARGEPADKALQAAAKAWSDRTRALGTERQRWHYRRSLNSLATSPEPPARESN
jgi:multiple sugar transport system substrate-binding protein